MRRDGERGSEEWVRQRGRIDKMEERMCGRETIRIEGEVNVGGMRERKNRNVKSISDDK